GRDEPGCVAAYLGGAHRPQTAHVEYRLVRAYARATWHRVRSADHYHPATAGRGHRRGAAPDARADTEDLYGHARVLGVGDGTLQACGVRPMSAFEELSRSAFARAERQPDRNSGIPEGCRPRRHLDRGHRERLDGIQRGV